MKTTQQDFSEQVRWPDLKTGHRMSSPVTSVSSQANSSVTVARKIQMALPECREHPGQRCEAHCNNCNQSACIKCILSGLHKGHAAEELSKTHERKVQKRIKETQLITTKIIPNYQKKDVEIETTMSEAKLECDHFGKENVRLKQMWHQEVDNIFDRVDTLSKSLLDKNLGPLRKYQEKIRNLIFEMTETVKQNEQILKANKVTQVNILSSNLKKYQEVPEKIMFKMPPHISNLIPGNEYGIGIGNFKATLLLKSNTTSTSVLSSSTTSQGLAQLLDDPRLIATIHTDYPSVKSIACLGIREAWISGSKDRIRFVDINGSVKNTISSNFPGECMPGDITVTKMGNLLFSNNSHEGGTVKIAKNELVEIRIQLSSKMFSGGLCYTRSGDILVHIIDDCFDGNTLHKISRYRGQKIVQEIETDEQRKHIFEPNTMETFVSLILKPVVVLDRTGQVRFRYDGTPARSKQRFNPGCIVTDCLGQIIVTDSKNECLHILDQNGQFLKCLVGCSLEKPFGLSVDGLGRLWVGSSSSGKVRVIEYLNGS
uniref:Uncharacterized protein LOC111110130 isoform X2 n=1 Tax=Crassostrea virginica TaxID=6565 RepID=A0A8B8BHB2_CRAVI|nr:uncharacterized protein LOC111110130 isoform X2 [Crassostrea virginica]